MSVPQATAEGRTKVSVPRATSPQATAVSTKSLAFVRVFKLETPVSLPDEPRFGGRRSWVSLPDAPGMENYQPVLDDQAHRRVESQIPAALEG
ncbi:MAG: DUF1802 family protein [Verrucomicrobia bacterium]|nr:DUF1802 family protein [Verrucomicrobiota bacterium]